MYRSGQQLLHSATDLVAFLDCAHRTVLDRAAVDTPVPRAEDDPYATLLQQKGIAHEKAFLGVLRARHASVVEIADAPDLDRDARLRRRAEDTLAAMRAGVEVIYQATLLDGNLVGHADFLRRVDGPSRLGAWHYEVLDTKLARSPQPKFVIQLAFYSRLLAAAQGVEPAWCHVVTGDARRTEHPFRVADATHYVAHQLQRYLEHVEAPRPTYPDPCAACDLCRWREACEQRRVDDDHPCQVANITGQQIRRLQAAGVGTMAALAALPAEAVVPKVSPVVLERLRSQAALQHRARTDGGRHLELLPPDADGRLGFHRLPPPDPHDLYFDMEGDPLEVDGLEYLFGVWGRGVDPAKPGEEGFRAFWAHDRAEEKRAFEAFVDFVTAHLNAHPGAHVYHYASYERTAIERLMCWHATREDEVDRLFKEQRLVDLYAVVKGAIRISEPSYSIKAVERFYRPAREGGVTNAGQSVVWYEQWRETGEARLLEEIERYNRDDVESTRDLHRWLLGLRAEGMAWRGEASPGDEAASPAAGAPSRPLNARAEAARARALACHAARERLQAALPADERAWTDDDAMRSLTALLLDFHRRARKPALWAMYDRMTWDDERLVEDVECLGGLSRRVDIAPRAVGHSLVWTYRFPEQETKLAEGADVKIAATGVPAMIVRLDAAAGEVGLRVAKKQGEPAECIGLGPAGPLDDSALEAGVLRFAESLIAGGGRYLAVERLLRRERPRITGQSDGADIVDARREALPQIIEAITRLERSVLFVQGPPGAGKTWTGARVIVELMRRGLRVGVASNSHKAIHNLLAEVENVAAKQGFAFRGAKKLSSKDPDESRFDGANFENLERAAELADPAYRLVAGTAWLFADPAMDDTVDHLFVDEAGQVALANLVAMGTSARNLVLLGDPMQLAQPVQGVHPGRSGESALEWLIDGNATVAADRGIFLDRTFRMPPELCRFVSEAVYDGRLLPDACTADRRLVLREDAHAALKPAGLAFLPVPHDACSHHSDEEVEAVKALIASLLSQRYRDGLGGEHDLELKDVLIVAPYNAQVRRLKQRLPEGARVGTVDKFQGQEAQVVIVSMTTSSDAYLPRNKAFLYSRNRLNVAVSRGKCLAIVVASPGLLEARCSTTDEVGLVNLLCWAAAGAVARPVMSSLQIRR
ncbi:MAG: TM0106 family RecB-like putative nuclease [Burkholderiales bacterium]